MNAERWGRLAGGVKIGLGMIITMAQERTLEYKIWFPPLHRTYRGHVSYTPPLEAEPPFRFPCLGCVP